MKIEEFIDALDKRTMNIKLKDQYAEYRHRDPEYTALRSAQVIALAERVCGIITHCEMLTDRVEALEKRRDSK